MAEPIRMKKDKESRANCKNREFLVSEISAEIKISISHGRDEEILFSEIKECVQKWNRRAKKRDGSRTGYCIELTGTKDSNRNS